MELRAVGEHAVLVGRDETGRRRSVDPHSLALSTELAEALHDWARVAAAVLRRNRAQSDPADQSSVEQTSRDVGALVSARGKQLAVRLSTEMGVPVTYADPVTEEVALLGEQPAAPPESTGFLARARIDWLAAARTGEPTPWLTGVTVTGFSALIVLLTVLSLSSALYESSVLLAVAANLVIAAGVSPSVWLLGRLPVWRWVAYGVLAGILLSWLIGLVSLL